jgi:putative DNA primase/helicase
MGGIPPESVPPELLAAALRYVRLGYRIFPLHYPAIGRDGRLWCSCGKADCNAAKHPLTPNGLKDAALDEQCVQAWWERWPEANIGIALPIDIIVLDTDPRHGGDASLRLLCDKYSPLPETPTTLTGGGGTHHYLRLPSGVKVGNRANVLGRGLDIKTAGGYVLAPPSRHISGRAYEWEITAELGELAIAAVPQWLLELIGQSTAQKNAARLALPAVVHDGSRNDTLFRFARALHAKQLGFEEISAALKSVNGARCNPPLGDDEVERIARKATVEPDRPDFVGRDTEMADPAPLPGALPSVPMFDERLLPEALRPWLVDISERTQVPLDFAAAPSIVVLGSTIGRRLGIRPKRFDDWLVIPNLFGVIVAPPGFLKSPLLHETMKPLMRLEAEARDVYERAMTEYEAQFEAVQAERKKLIAKFSRAKSGLSRDELIAQLRELKAAAPVQQRFIVNDATVEKLGEILKQNPAGLLLFRDEGAGWLALLERSGHENDRSFYLEAWNGYGSYTYDRIGRGTVHIESACVSILCAITPGPLSAYLRETFAGVKDDGLIQRFQLGVYPDPPADWRNVDRWPDTAAKNRAFELFKHFVGFVSDPQADDGIPFLHFDDEAQDFFDSWRADLEARIRNSDEHPIIRGHLGKYRSLMPSLALITHLCDWPDLATPVTLEATQRAAAWCDYLEAHARRIYHALTARVDTAARLLGEKIRAHKLPDLFAARDVYRHEWIGLTEPNDVARALEVLESLSWLVAELPRSGPAGGRPAMRYRVNPKIWSRT